MSTIRPMFAFARLAALAPACRPTSPPPSPTQIGPKPIGIRGRTDQFVLRFRKSAT
ncbi:MAG: hypothetical protein ACYDAE_03195 [Steroidobacteraceae bacterium]